MILVMEGDKQVAGIPVKIVKSTMSKIQSKQDDVDIVILEDLSEITKNVIIRKEHGTITTSFVFFLFYSINLYKVYHLAKII